MSRLLDNSSQKKPTLSRDPSMHFDFEALTGFFAHSDPNTTESEIGPVPPRFGLLDSSPEYWRNLDKKLDALQEASPDALFKIVWAGRHGQGWHNVGEAKYGTKAWDEYWAMLNGDGEIVWGPDPQLTPLGEEQAKLAQSVWKKELAHGVPLPQSLYSSPFSRALNTARITFTSIPPSSSSLQHGSPKLPPILVVENTREVSGEHTCDRRDTLSYINRAYVDPASRGPEGPEFVVEEGFEEEDELWTTERETDEHVRERVVDVLDRIFEYDSARYISITAHSGWITQLLVATGHRKYNLPTGGVLPLVIKATRK